MAQVSSQLELQQALIANDPLIEVIESFSIAAQMSISYPATIKSACGIAQPAITRASGFTIEPMFFVPDGGALTLDSITVNGNGVMSSSAAIVTRGALTLTNATVTNAFSADNGGGIRVEDGGVLTLLSSFVIYSGAQSGGGIYVADGGSAALFCSGVDRNTADISGGGIYIANGGTLEGYSSSTYGNSAPAGTGIYNAGFLGVAEEVMLTDGVYIPSRENAIVVLSRLACACIQLEASAYINSATSDAPVTVAVGTASYPVLSRQDVCAFKLPADDLSGRYLSLGTEGGAVLLNVYPEYSITYENLMGAVNQNPPTYSEPALPLFFTSLNRTGDFVFAGWFTQSLGGQPVTFLPRGTVGDIVLFARWNRLR